MCKKRMIIVRGLPGSGKSSIAVGLGVFADNVCAIDDYWFRPDGTYDFNYDHVLKSYEWNQHRVARIMVDIDQRSEQLDGAEGGLCKTTIVIDNVNITFDEILPYARLAQMYHYSIELMEPQTEWRYDVETCYKNNAHNVPYSTVLRMSREWEPTADIVKRLIRCGFNVLKNEE